MATHDFVTTDTFHSCSKWHQDPSLGYIVYHKAHIGTNIEAKLLTYIDYNNIHNCTKFDDKVIVRFGLQDLLLLNKLRID